MTNQTVPSSLKIKTNVRAGAPGPNHGLRIKTKVRAGDALLYNHGLRVRSLTVV